MSGPTALGLDPGFAALGWAVVELGMPLEAAVLGIGVICTEKSAAKCHVLASDDNLRRARAIATALRALVERFRPAVVCCESMSWPRNAGAAAKVALAWGVVAAEVDRLGIAVCQASPQALKFAVAGSKTATKEQVQAALVHRFGATVRTWLDGTRKGDHEHGADALGAVVACENSDVMRAIRAIGKAAA